MRIVLKVFFLFENKLKWMVHSAQKNIKGGGIYFVDKLTRQQNILDSSLNKIIFEVGTFQFKYEKK